MKVIKSNGGLKYDGFYNDLLLNNEEFSTKKFGCQK